MDNKTINKRIEEEIKLLANKEIEITSQNGLVTILLSGSTTYKDVKINGNLSDIYKEELEEEILNALALARNELQKQINEAFESVVENILEDSRKEEDDSAITIENVS